MAVKLPVGAPKLASYTPDVYPLRTGSQDVAQAVLTSLVSEGNDDWNRDAKERHQLQAALTASVPSGATLVPSSAVAAPPGVSHNYAPCF